MYIHSNNDPQQVFDQHFTLKCPHCAVTSAVSAISIPRYELVRRFEIKRVAVGYRCNACNEPICLIFAVTSRDNPVVLSKSFTEVQRPSETFEYQYLPSAVADDLREALTCYSQSCLNAFAAMCRRCIQTVCMQFGAQGSTKVQNQLNDLKEMGAVDEESFEVLKQVILSGHDGAHPHLPELSAGRASVLLQLMKDVLHQLFVRQAKIKEAATLRTQAAQNR